MGLKAGTPIHQVAIDQYSSDRVPMPESKTCEPPRKWSRVIGLTRVNAMVVPGSGQVKRQAEQEGLNKIFQRPVSIGREAGCSMCLAMNRSAGTRSAMPSTSNRNLKASKGRWSNTLGLSAMALQRPFVVTFTDIRQWDYQSSSKAIT